MWITFAMKKESGFSSLNGHLKLCLKIIIKKKKLVWLIWNNSKLACITREKPTAETSMKTHNTFYPIWCRGYVWHPYHSSHSHLIRETRVIKKQNLPYATFTDLSIKQLPLSQISETLWEVNVVHPTCKCSKCCLYWVKKKKTKDILPFSRVKKTRNFQFWFRPSGLFHNPQKTDMIQSFLFPEGNLFLLSFSWLKPSLPAHERRIRLKAHL